MAEPERIAAIVAEVMEQLRRTGSVVLPASPAPQPEMQSAGDCEDLTSPACKKISLLDHPQDPEALERMRGRTTARIGVGRAGPRLKTKTMLTLRADHAQARDAVFADVDSALPQRLGLFTVETRCGDKDTYLTRPDLGRRLSEEAAETLRQRCIPHPDVQIFASDGLSSTAVEANLEKILPALTDGLKARGLTVGTPFLLRFGRVAAEDHVAEILGAKVVCILLGERPGLATAESMSAYIVYNAYVGIPESKRTVVSNIHKDGISAVEAGAYLTEVICKILEQKASGVDLVK